MGQVVFKLEADEAKAVQGILRVTDALKKAGAGTDGLKSKGKSMGARFATDLKSMAAGYIGVQAAIRLASAALQKYNEIRQRGADRIRGAESSMQKLAQLSGGDPAQMARMTAAARLTAKTEGVSAGRGADLQFALESMGMAAHRKTFASTFRLADDPALLAGGAGTMQAAMGKAETGSARQVLNKLFGASAVSKTTVEEFAPAATTAARSVGRLGGSDEEFLAALAHVSKATKSADVGGTQIGAFADVMRKKGIGGSGLMAAARQVQAMGMDDATLIKWFGRKEGRKGYENMLALAGPIAGTTAELGRIDAERGPDDLLGRMLGARESDPQLKAARDLRLAEQPGNVYGGMSRLAEKELFESRQRWLEEQMGDDPAGRAIATGREVAGAATMQIGMQPEEALYKAGVNIFSALLAPSAAALLDASENMQRAAANGNLHTEGGP